MTDVARPPSDDRRTSGDESAHRARTGRRGGRLATVVATITGNLFLFFGTLLFGVVGVAVSFVPPRGHHTFTVARVWARCVLASAGVRVRSRSLARLDPAASHIFLANHQSLYDIPAVIATAPHQVRFAAKRSLFLVPVFGRSLRAMGFIPVDRADRKDRGKAQGVLSAAQELLAGGLSVLFFPEGQRSYDGALLPFERGGFLLALKTGLPVVPVSIEGTLAARVRGSFLISPADVTVVYGEPIDPTEFGVRRRGELEALVAERIEAGRGRRGTI